MPFPPPSSHLYLPSRLPRPSSSPHSHSTTSWPNPHGFPSRPHSAPTSQERTTHQPPIGEERHWLDSHSTFGPSGTSSTRPTTGGDEGDDFDGPLPLSGRPGETSGSAPPLYPFPFSGSIPTITTSSSTSYDDDNEVLQTPRPTQMSFLPSDLMYDPPLHAHAALSERLRYRTHLQQRTLTFSASSPVSPSSSASSASDTADPYRSWPSPRRRPPQPPARNGEGGGGGGTFENATLPEGIRGYATHAGWLDDVYRVDRPSSGRLVRGRDIVRDRDVFPGEAAPRELGVDEEGSRDVEEGDVLVCGGKGNHANTAGLGEKGEIRFFFAPSSSSASPSDTSRLPIAPLIASTPQRGCDTPLVLPQQQSHPRPIEFQTMDFLEILTSTTSTTSSTPATGIRSQTTTTTETEHAWVRERGWLVILPPSAPLHPPNLDPPVTEERDQRRYEVGPPRREETRVMGCGCLLQKSIVCLDCGSPLGHLLLKTCSRHTHPLSPLAPNTSGATTLLFDARAVRVRRAALVRPRQRLAVSPSPSSSSWSGERRSRTRTTSSSAMTMVGSDDGGAELPKWAADAEDALAAVVGTERSMERGERMIGQRWKGAVGR